jgi:hypothetical protein
MIHDEFLNLDIHDRAEFAFEFGDFVSVIEYYGFKICLYIVEGVFIEVFYNAHDNKIEDVEILEPNERRLYLYARTVDITGLFK